jgi:hypothetical protein
VPYNATVPEAADVGVSAWSVDPATTITSGSFVAATQYLAAVYYRPDPYTAPLPSKFLLPGVVVGSWTLAQLGLVCMDQCGQNAPGTLLGSSTAALPTAGITVQGINWVAAAPAALPEGRYWICLVVTGTLGTALSASCPATATSGANLGTDLPHARFGIAGTTVANVVPANIVTAGAGLQLCAAIQ